MKRRKGIISQSRLLLGSILVLTTPTAVLSQNGVAFNGTYNASPAITGGTSKLENTSANVLNSVTQVTVCFWVYPNAYGENQLGYIFVLDEQDGNAAFALRMTSTRDSLLIFKGAGAAGTNGVWTIPLIEQTWNAVCVRLNFGADNAPTALVNFAVVTPSTQTAPSGIQDLPATGYCVGNRSAQDRTWNGSIAHLQVFNSILSDANAAAALRNPGSYTTGLRLYLPMRNSSDVSDLSGNAFHGTGTDLVNANNFPPFGSFLHFGAMDRTIDLSLLIGPNGNEPAGGVIGIGERTKITAGGSVNTGARFVTNEGYGASSVIEPTVRDIYVFGNQAMPDHPFGNGTEIALSSPVAHGIALDGDAPTVSGCKVYDFRGNGIAVSNTTSEFSRMIRIARVTNNKISHCWTGIAAGAVDAQIDGNRIASVRDYGIIDTAGSVQCSNNHVFGARWGIYFTGGSSRSIGDRFSDANYGFFVDTDASGSDIIGGTTEHCSLKNIDIHGQRVQIANCRIFVARTSTQHPGLNNNGITSILGCDLHWDGTRAVMTDCEVKLGDYTFPNDSGFTGSTGVYVQQHNTRIENLRVSGTTDTAEIGVRIANDRDGIYVEADSSGGAQNFNDTNDAVVKFDDDPDTWMTSGIVYVIYESGETPVRIEARWPSSLQIWTRVNTSPTWTQLTAGTAYP